jgi:predicted nucleic acid-binding protein
MASKPVLVDSSVWIDHLGGGDAVVSDLLKRRRIVMHPMIIGEIAMGSLRQRKFILEELKQLPAVHVATHAEVMAMVEWHDLYSKGIGFVDAHLLASAHLSQGAKLLTRDKRLGAQAERLGVAYEAVT